MTSVSDEAVAGRYEATLAAAKVAIQAARSRAVLAASVGRLTLHDQSAEVPVQADQLATSGAPR
jgi:hypothetical protein